MEVHGGLTNPTPAFISWDTAFPSGFCLVQVIQDRLVHACTAYSRLLVSGSGCQLPEEPCRMTTQKDVWTTSLTHSCSTQKRTGRLNRVPRLKVVFFLSIKFSSLLVAFELIVVTCWTGWLVNYLVLTCLCFIYFSVTLSTGHHLASLS